MKAEGLTGLGYRACLVNHKPGHGCGFVVGQIPADRAVELTDRGGSIDDDRAIALFAHALYRNVVLIANIANDLLDYVLKRDHPLHDAVLINDERGMGLSAQELLELVTQRSRFRDEPRLQREIDNTKLAGISASRDIRPEQVLGVEDADNIVWLPTPERHPGIGRRDHLAHQLLWRQVGVDKPHFGAVNHHVRDGDLGQFQKAAEHIALVALDFAFAMQDVDRAHQFFMARNARVALAERDAAQAQDAAHQDLDRAHDRTEYGHEEGNQRRDEQRNAIRIGDSDGLRHHLAENDNQRGHDRSRGPHAALAEGLK